MMEQPKIYWLTQEEVKILKSKLENLESVEAEGILQELKVSSHRAEGTKLPVDKLGNALGLKDGSVPIWLTDKEHKLVKLTIKK